MTEDSMNPKNPERELRERQLDSLFVRYCEACGSPEPDPNFMPMLWQKIELRQSKNVLFERLARTFVAGTMAACGLLGLLLVLPGQQQSAFDNGSYVEAIADADARESVPFIEPVRFDLGHETGSSNDHR
jgi:hypothetical protein